MNEKSKPLNQSFNRAASQNFKNVKNHDITVHKNSFCFKIKNMRYNWCIIRLNEEGVYIYIFYT